MSQTLIDLLRLRMADEELGPEDPLAVAELHKRLLPYHTCRDRLGFATKAEYDFALLRLLADDERVAVAEPALREAVRAEMRHPEPGLAFLHRFAASEIRVRPGTPAEETEQPSTDDVGTPADHCRKCAAELPQVEGVRFCPSCGADQAVPTCGECGREMEDEWSYCAFCGARVV